MDSWQRLVPALLLVAVALGTAPCAADILIVTQMGQEHLAELEKLLAPAKPRTAGTITYFQGQVVDIHYLVDVPENAHPLQHVVFRAVAYGEGGTERTPAPVAIPAGWVSIGQEEIDTALDFRRFLSNRHELLGVPVGDPRHRAAFFAAIDPDGSLGLRGGEEPTLSGAVEEGHVTLTIRSEPVPDEERLRLRMTRPHDVRLMLRTGRDTCDALLLAVARARRYPKSFEPGFGDQAEAALGLLCALAQVNEDLVPAAHRGVARRARRWGYEAMESVTAALWPRPADDPLLDPSLGAWGNRELPVDGSDRMRAAVAVIAREPAFDVYASPPLGIWAENLLEALLAAGGGTGKRGPPGRRAPEGSPSYIPPEAVTEAVLALLVRLAGKGHPDSPAMPEHRARWRCKLQSELLNEHQGQARLARRALERIGWGEPREVMPLIDALFNNVDSLMHRIPDPAAPSDLEGLDTLIAVLRRLQGGGETPATKGYARRVSDRIAEARKEASETTHRTADRRFLERYDAASDESD